MHLAVPTRRTLDGGEGLFVMRPHADENHVILVIERKPDPRQHGSGKRGRAGDRDQDRGAILPLAHDHLDRRLAAAMAPAQEIRRKLYGDAFTAEHEDDDRQQSDDAPQNRPAVP